MKMKGQGLVEYTIIVAFVVLVVGVVIRSSSIDIMEKWNSVSACLMLSSSCF